jgi:hypothetical protein
MDFMGGGSSNTFCHYNSVAGETITYNEPIIE